MTTFLPHDLLWIDRCEALPADAPDWACEAVRQGDPVVVRRARCEVDQVAVGVRGRSRGHRYATVVRKSAVLRHVSPEQLSLATAAVWPALQALCLLEPVLNATSLVWGVGGSAGFELATGIRALHQDSDLDLILRTPEPLDRQQAAQLLQQLHTPLCRVDAQLQTPCGGVALGEWASAARRVLLKANEGARLVSDPWQPLEYAA